MLQAGNVILTPLIASDSESLYRWINNRELVHLNSSYRPVSEDQHRKWFESIQQCKEVVIFAIRLMDSNKLIGSCQLHNINHVHQNAELQIRIGEQAEQAKGYGTKALKLLLNFAFSDLNLHRVYLHVFVTNKQAIHAYTKAGFKQEGQLRDAAFINGQLIDVQVMGILRNEFCFNASL